MRLLSSAQGLSFLHEISSLGDNTMEDKGKIPHDNKGRTTMAIACEGQTFRISLHLNK